MSIKREKCTECDAYTGHGPLCQKIGLKEAKKQLRMYYLNWEKLETFVRKMEKAYDKKISQRHGKYHIE